MDLNVGDLFITKEWTRNKKTPAIVIALHDIELDKYWVCKSATLQTPDGKTERLSLEYIESNLNTVHARQRWYYYPVKK